MILESVFDKNNFFSYKQQGMAIQCLSFEKVDSVMYDKSLKFRFPPFSQERENAKEGKDTGL